MQVVLGRSNPRCSHEYGVQIVIGGLDDFVYTRAPRASVETRIIRMPQQPTMTAVPQDRPFKRYGLLIFLSVVLCLGFVATSIISFHASKTAIRDSIIHHELPLTTDNIYSEIQKDLVRPVFISSMMASDTFLRDWVLHGEVRPELVAKYLADVKARSNAFTSFLAVNQSLNYYYGNGDQKTLSPDNPDDDWYFHVRDLSAPYELNVDQDARLGRNLIVFVNYRMFDYQGRYMGATGVGITVYDVQQRLDQYQARYQRSVYFVDQHGRIVLSGDPARPAGQTLAQLEGLAQLQPQLNENTNLSSEYQADGRTYLVNVRYIPELKWFVVVEKNEAEATSDIRQTLYLNLVLCALVTFLVLLLTHVSIRRYEQKIQALSRLDHLTGVANRAAFDDLIPRILADQQRSNMPLSMLMCDIDFFKKINDQYGHLAGDAALQRVAHLLKERVRRQDVVVRWGGEEFLLLLKNCTQQDALRMANMIRTTISAQPVVYQQYQFAVTVSIGVATRLYQEDVEAWLSRADGYLYEAKRLGRNQVVGEDQD